MTPPASAAARASDRFVSDLIAYMTLEEKLGQLDILHPADDPGLEAAIAAGRVGGVAGTVLSHRLQALATERSRLGIPLLLTALHPLPPALALSPWAMAASWDEDLARTLGTAAAAEALRREANSLAAPRVAIAGSRKGGDGAHIAGCDAYLAGRLTAAFAAGAAGNGGPSGVLAIAACDTEDPEEARRLMTALAPAAQVAAFDCPATGPDSARRAGFDGLLIAECRRIRALLSSHFAVTSARSAIEAAGRAITDGLIDEAEIDDAVRRVLSAKHALGLFRDTHRTVSTLTPPRRETANGADAEVVRKTMVLLRNEAGLLPLAPVSDRLLVVGPADGAGGACAEALVRAGIGHSSAPGLALRREGESWAEPVPGDHFALAISRDAARRSDFVLLALDARHFAPDPSGPWQTPTPAALALVQAVSGTGSRVAAIIATAEPVDLGDADQHCAAVLHCWNAVPGFAEALGDVLSGRNGPQGRLPVAVGRYPLGHGLGLGESVLSGFAVALEGHAVVATVRVRNAGSFPLRETVQVYVRGASGALRLAGFDHVTLAPGEDVPVRFALGGAALGTLGATGYLEVAAGRHEILLGKSATRLLSGDIELTPTQARTVAAGGPLLRSVGAVA